MLTQERKAEIVAKFGGSAANTGLPEVRIALLTEHIGDLSKHIEQNPKDHHNRRGLIKMVSKRRKLLDYLTHTDIKRYRAVIAALNIRK